MILQWRTSGAHPSFVQRRRWRRRFSWRWLRSTQLSTASPLSLAHFNISSTRTPLLSTSFSGRRRSSRPRCASLPSRRRARHTPR